MEERFRNIGKSWSWSQSKDNIETIHRRNEARLGVGGRHEGARV